MLRILLALTIALSVTGCRSLNSHTPCSSLRQGKPRIGGAQIYGNRPSTPFLYTIAATGARPMTFSAEGLPNGLELDSSTGIVTGRVDTPGSYTVTVHAVNSKGSDRARLTFNIGDQLALTPPMGWMSWNQFGPNISEQLLREVADAMVQTGMRDAGYQYIFIDDHWHGQRDENALIHPDPNKFPSGIKAVADYVHSKGLKLGIYSDAAHLTCGGEPGSFGYEDIDAGTYAKWGIDYLKYDYCHAPRDTAAAIERYRTMGDALKNTDRSIVFGICEWGQRKPWLWGPEVGGHLWRTTWDIRDSWRHKNRYDDGHAGIVSILDKQLGLEKYAGPGQWNDPDMLVAGLRGEGLAASRNNALGCSDTEYRSQMSLWCLLAAPLYASCDVRNMDHATRDILTNTEAIAVNQDPLARQGYLVAKDGDLEVYAKPLANGHWAVGLLNRSDTTADITVNFEDIGIHGKYHARDLWHHKDLGPFTRKITRTVNSHQTILLRLHRPTN